jgi:hypothetical protein
MSSSFVDFFPIVCYTTKQEATMATATLMSPPVLAGVTKKGRSLDTTFVDGMTKKYQFHDNGREYKSMLERRARPTPRAPKDPPALVSASCPQTTV